MKYRTAAHSPDARSVMEHVISTPTHIKHANMRQKPEVGHYLGHLTSLPDGELVVMGEFSEDAGYTQAGRCGTGEETRDKREHPQAPTQVSEVALIRGPRGS